MQLNFCTFRLFTTFQFIHITYTGNFYFVDLFASGRKNKYLKYSLHIVGWLAFLLLPSAFSLEGSVDFHHLFDNQHKLNNLFYYILWLSFLMSIIYSSFRDFTSEKNTLPIFRLSSFAFLLSYFFPKAWMLMINHYHLNFLASRVPHTYLLQKNLWRH